MLYSTRTTMPLLIPAVANEKKWSKTDSGTILSSFFWGYTLTQVLGGYLSDKYGGQRVIFVASIFWTLITIFMPNFIQIAPTMWNMSLPFIVFVRILNGACQGVHFPSMMSITSQNLSSTESSSFFSILTAGSAIGTLLTGTLGSFILDYFGWSSVFRVIGCLGLAWTLMLRYYTMSSERSRIINVSQPNRLCSKLGTSDEVPWLRLLSKKAIWACLLGHACEMNCFFVLLSWLPTYFHDNFPHAKVSDLITLNQFQIDNLIFVLQPWITNMMPWLLVPPCTLIAKYLTEHLLTKKYTLTSARKIVQTICYLSQNLALLIMCHTTNFYIALSCMSIIIGVTGFHNGAISVNPQDLSPNHSGSVFGLMNTIGAIPGFLGVYLAGHILELTQSWSAVFSTAAAINCVGWLIFTLFGSAEELH